MAKTIKLLVIGGGGGGGKMYSAGGGGGGAGGYQSNDNYTVIDQQYNITVGSRGDGGIAGNPGISASNGGNSVFDVITADGGGSGGTDIYWNPNGGNGGCGGGGCGNYGSGGTGYQGGNGGDGFGTNRTGGGGGGAGGNGAGGNTGGAGGIGTSNSITGVPITYCVGGGGAGYGSFNGATDTQPGAGGGGGGLSPYNGFNGVDGVVIISYPTDGSTGITSVTVTGSYALTTYTVGGVVWNVYTFNGNGTFAPFVAPTVTTQSCSNISYTTLTGNGTILTVGSNPIIKRGICYMTGAGTPTTANNKVEESGSFGTGTFTESITSLTANTLYSFAAYVIDSTGTYYGSTVQATTLTIIVPTVTTQSCTGIANTSLTGNGNIADTGGENANIRGICYISGYGTPTTSNNVVSESGSFGTGAFTESITGLTNNTVYSFRAYAINSAGTGYGTTVQQTTANANYLGNFFLVL